MTEAEFTYRFSDLTGNEALRWQERLFHKHFVPHLLPHVIDLPTGLGKTMVMAIWLIAREVNKNLPRRLIYVVDRRTVVDQASDLAMLLVKNWREKPIFVGEPPAISTLRGQLADNREWSRDPSRPAIIIGTVDLIGSALLFSGYRSSYKTRPLHAGLLGQDSLLVLDEAHLSKPFEKLVKSIERDGLFQKDRQGKSHGTPMKVIRMSATGGNRDAGRFKLEDSDFADKIINERFTARKLLTITPDVDAKKLNESLADAAIKLAQNRDLRGKRIVVFVRKPDDAMTIAQRICDHEKPSKSKSNPHPKGPFADAVDVLTGTMRGLERDELVGKRVFEARWLKGGLVPADQSNQSPVFLISTSAGEVGFDLNADHMVCDAAPLDSMIQRLGRVNRRGTGDATVLLFHDPINTTDKDGKPRRLEGLEKSIANTLELLKPVSDVSPKNLAALKQSSEWQCMQSDGRSKYDHACSPEPTMVELTDILLDAWSMTSIRERMPGRPEVAPWLRGIADELPQTTIAWRAELDLFQDDPNPQKPLKAIFAKHRIRPHELLTTNSYRVVDFFKEITKKNKRPDLLDTRVVVKFSRDLVVTTIGKLLDNPGILNADPTLILPATFGGLEKGMLNHEAIPTARQLDHPAPESLDVADEPGYEARESASPRLRILIERTSEGWKAMPLPGGAPIPSDFNLEPSYATSTLLFRAIASTDLRVRLVQPVAFDDEGDPVLSLVMLSPVADKAKKEDQPLTDHVGDVETEALRIADELDLKDPIRGALLFAAKWHDEGKKAAIWQNYVYGTDPNNPKGKSATTRDPKSLRGYRHEFGSLLRIHHPEQHQTDCVLPADHEARELALHLIATHHGFGRPHFANPFDRNFKTEQCEGIHTESIRRFACLQRKYGWWRLAWLENLLRCADALASADQDAEDESMDESSEAAGDMK